VRSSTPHSPSSSCRKTVRQFNVRRRLLVKERPKEPQYPPAPRTPPRLSADHNERGWLWRISPNEFWRSIANSRVSGCAALPVARSRHNLNRPIGLWALQAERAGDADSLAAWGFRFMTAYRRIKLRRPSAGVSFPRCGHTRSRRERRCRCTARRWTRRTGRCRSRAGSTARLPRTRRSSSALA
jgi:hypothetical protein